MVKIMSKKCILAGFVAVAVLSFSACNDSVQQASVADTTSMKSEITTTTGITTTKEPVTVSETTIPETTTTEPVTSEITTTSSETTTSVIVVETTVDTTVTTTYVMETSAETTTDEITTVSETTITEAESTEPPIEIPQDVSFDKEAAERLSMYGIDAEKREEYYTHINKRADIPVIHISTKDKAEILSLEEYVDCLVDVIGCDEEYVLGAEEAGIRVRGNSTAYYGDVNQVRHNQVPYRIKFKQKTNMLGLNDGAECKSWVLLKSNWNLIMDYTAFNLADAIFNGEYYYSDCAFVHLYINEKFIGVYLLCEQNQVNKNRVDIYEPEPDYKGTDIGYFFEIDNYAVDGDKPYFYVDYLEAEVTDIQGEIRNFVPAEYSIDSDIYTDEQTEFIGNYVNNVFKILYEATQKGNYLTFDENMNLVNVNDKFDNAYDTVNAVMDVNSVVNMYILYEICHDYDCGEGSFYMAVDFSENSEMKRLTFTAPWDFNWAYNDSPTRIYYAGAFNQMSFVNQYGDRTNPWFVLFMTQDWFKELVSEKWEECYDSGRIFETLTDIENYLNTYTDDLNRFDQWGTDNAFKLLEWVTRRCRWLDKEFKSFIE